MPAEQFSAQQQDPSTYPEILVSRAMQARLFFLEGGPATPPTEKKNESGPRDLSDTHALLYPGLCSSALHLLTGRLMPARLS